MGDCGPIAGAFARLGMTNVLRSNVMRTCAA